MAEVSNQRGLITITGDFDSPTGTGTSSPTTSDRTLRRIRRINRETGAQWTQEQMLNYAQAVDAGNVTLDQIQAVATDQGEIRARNRERARLLSSNLGLPKEFVDQFIDDYLELGDVELALTELRQSPTYEQYFPGNTRDDGTVRYSEREYQQVVEFYATTLEDYGVNPDVFDGKFGDLIGGDVAPDEFAGRVDSMYSRIIRAPEEVQQEAASIFGLDRADPSSLLAAALDPEIGEQVMQRRISTAQLTGQARRFGFRRSRARAEKLLDLGLTGDQASQFYSGAVPTLARLGGSAATTGERFSLSDLEDAAIGSDPGALSTAARLSAQESSRFSRAGSVRRDQSGGLSGLGV